MTGKKYAFMAVTLMFSLAVTACGQSNDSSATESASSSETIVADDEITSIDVGSMDAQNKYTNETLGLEIQLPATWYYLSVAEMDENDEYQAQQNPTLAESLEYTTNLVYGIDEENQTTNFLQITTESIRDISDPKEVLTTAKASLDTLKEELAAGGLTNVEVSEVEEQTIDNLTFYSLKTIAPLPDQPASASDGALVTTTSEMYVAKLDDQTFLKLMFNYGDASGEEATKSTLNSIKYTK